jgi:hypothetical protein
MPSEQYCRGRQRIEEEWNGKTCTHTHTHTHTHTEREREREREVLDSNQDEALN